MLPIGLKGIPCLHTDLRNDVSLAQARINCPTDLAMLYGVDGMDLGKEIQQRHTVTLIINPRTSLSQITLRNNIDKDFTIMYPFTVEAWTRFVTSACK